MSLPQKEYCKKGHELVPTEDKYRRSDGSARCPECGRQWQREYYLANREQENERSRSHRIANRERYREYARKWRLAHPDYYRGYYKKRVEENLSG